METAELLEKKELLITQGMLMFSDLAIIADTLGNYQMVNQHGPYHILEHEDITLIHCHKISHPVTRGSMQIFVKWMYEDFLFITVGDRLRIGKHSPEIFRTDRVAYLFLVNNDCDATSDQIDSQIFVPYHLNWLVRVMTLLPQAHEILSAAAKDNLSEEQNKIYKELFLDVHPEYQDELARYI